MPQRPGSRFSVIGIAAVFKHPHQNQRDSDEKAGPQQQRANQSFRHRVLRILGFSSISRNCIKAHIGNKDLRRASQDPLPAPKSRSWSVRGNKRHIVLRMNGSRANHDKHDNHDQLNGHDRILDAADLMNTTCDQAADDQYRNRRQNIDIRALSRIKATSQSNWQFNAETAQKALHIRRPARGNERYGDKIFRQQCPARDPAKKLAKQNVHPRKRRTSKRQH